MMNYLFRRSVSIASSASRQTLAALVSSELLRLPSLIQAEPFSSAAAAVSRPTDPFHGSAAAEKLRSGSLRRREFHFSAGPLAFRATDVARAEYAVEKFYDEERGSAKRGDEGLEIARLGISQQIVSDLAKKGITKLFPIQLWAYEQIPQSHLIKLVHAGTQGLPRRFSGIAHGGTVTHVSDKIIPQLSCSTEKNLLQTACNGKEGGCPKVMAFSPLEGSHTKERRSGLGNESSKIKKMELSQKITYALIPALLLVSKSAATTSLLIFSVYWQIYGFFKEIFLDYVHQEVTRKWVLIYFKLLLLILAKDTILDFDLV